LIYFDLNKITTCFTYVVFLSTMFLPYFWGPLFIFIFLYKLYGKEVKNTSIVYFRCDYNCILFICNISFIVMVKQLRPNLCKNNYCCLSTIIQHSFDFISQCYHTCAMWWKMPLVVSEATKVWKYKHWRYMYSENSEAKNGSCFCMWII